MCEHHSDITTVQLYGLGDVATWQESVIESDLYSSLSNNILLWQLFCKYLKLNK